ncbi:lipopolysaccharide biosynthesis protein [Butyrivibrio sp. JL13D10]|uniref:lipopolysaccharide biosynthesis protein n=1 Tax=Butyrivibrio sp. JL13D10 TaxID=3236815 RepID=UPI0038B656C7
MKIERTKNATRNIIVGMMLKVYQIFIPFVMRTIMIYFMGVQYLGLNGLFSSVLQVLNLAELGVGSAMVFSMYKPIAEDDTIRICALMKLYKLYYRAIGIVIGILGLVLLPFIPILIKGDIPTGINIYLLYLINLAATVFSYWLFAYKNSLLQAHQRMDVTSKIMLVTNTIQYAVQIIIIIFTKNYYYYVLAILGTQIINNIVTAIIVDKMYPGYMAQGLLDKKEVQQINQRIKDLFTSKIGFVVVDSADTIVISGFLGLTVLALYQNYFYIVSSVMGFIAVIFTSCTAGIGNSIIIDSAEKNFNDLKKLTLLISWICGVCFCCFLNLFQPFMELWVGKDLMLGLGAVVCFCVYFFIQEINKVLNLYKDASGIWHEDRYRPLVVAITNLSLNIFLVNFWGIYGILLSTVLATVCVGMPWILKNLFTTVFAKDYLKSYICNLLRYMLGTMIAGMVTFFMCNIFDISNLWMSLFIRGAISSIVPNVIFLFLYGRTQEFNDSISLVNKITKGKLLKFRFIRERCSA